LYSRYDALSKFSLVPRANPSTVYCARATVAFADKTMEARNAIPVLIAAAPALDDTANIATAVGASKIHALILGVSPRSFCQRLRLSEIVVIDRLVFCIRATYPTISRCTRAASLCSISLNICSSAMSFSISCTEVPDTCCSIEPILVAASSLSFLCCSRGAVLPRETTSRISPSSFEKPRPPHWLACALAIVSSSCLMPPD
jgi:hypothetical protein